MLQQMEPEAFYPFYVTRPAILHLIFLPLTAFFIIGIGILLTTDIRQAITDAENEVPELV